MEATLVNNDLGRVWLPKRIERDCAKGEVGIFVASQKRRFAVSHRQKGAPMLWSPEMGEGKSPDLGFWETIWASITHNERVDVGAAFQKDKVFVSATGVATSVAVATTGFTAKAKTDQSIGSVSSGATTNEITGSGLARATGTVQNYVAPSALGLQFSVDVYKSFTASGGVTAHGAALFNSNTPSGSIMYVEDQFSADAILITSDVLNVTATVTN